MESAMSSRSKGFQSAVLVLVLGVVAKLPAAIAAPQQQQYSSPAAIQAGKQLYTKLECATCHSIQGRGGCLGPSLDGVRTRRGPDYVHLRLSKQKENEFIARIGHPELFPHLRFDDKQVRELTAYLMTLPVQNAPIVKHSVKPSIVDKPPANFAAQAPTASSREGRRLILESGCLSCHSIAKTGGLVAPVLDGVGARHSQAFIEAYISNPVMQAKCAGKSTAMPQFDLEPDQVRAIKDYLLTLPAIGSTPKNAR